MKIQTKLVLCIGTTAFAAAALVLSLAFFFLNTNLDMCRENEDNHISRVFLSRSSEIVSYESKLINSDITLLLSGFRRASFELKSNPDNVRDILERTLKSIDSSASSIVYGNFMTDHLRNGTPAGENFFRDFRNIVIENEKVSEIQDIPFAPDSTVVRFIAENAVAGAGSIVINKDSENNNGLWLVYAYTPPDSKFSSFIASPMNGKFIRNCLHSYGCVSEESSTYAIIDDASVISRTYPQAGKDELNLPDLDMFKTAISASKNISLTAKSNAVTAIDPTTKDNWVIGIADLGLSAAGGSPLRLVKILHYEKSMPELTDQINSNMERLLIMISVITFIGLFIFLIPLVYFSKGISVPIERAVAFANILSKGEFPAQSLKTDGSDELIMLGKSLNHMRDRLNNIISKLRRSHDREIQARKDAEAANHLKSDFLSNMSLELRNPLNSIMGFSRLLLNDAQKGTLQNTADLKSALKSIFDSAETLNELVAALLNLAKLDTAEIIPHPSEHETSSIIRDAVEANAHAASEKSIMLESHYSPKAPDIIYIDREILSGILSLALSTLIKFSPSGSKISIGFSGSDENLSFWVKDEHPTTKHEHGASLASLYKLYYESKNQILPAIAATALLNFTIIKNKAHVICGELEAETVGGDCSLFRLVFNRSDLHGTSMTETSLMNTTGSFMKPLSASSTNVRITSTTKRTSKSGTYSKIRVLLAEDNEANRMLVEMMLKDTRCVIDSVSNGHECMEALNSKKYDVLLLDLHMPGLDGYSVISNVRSSDKFDHMAIIVLTAYLEEGDKEKLTSKGVSKCILKPIDMDDLKNSIYESLK